MKLGYGYICSIRNVKGQKVFKRYKKWNGNGEKCQNILNINIFQNFFFFGCIYMLIHQYLVLKAVCFEYIKHLFSSPRFEIVMLM